MGRRGSLRREWARRDSLRRKYRVMRTESLRDRFISVIIGDVLQQVSMSSEKMVVRRDSVISARVMSVISDCIQII